jgi:hypothetical protein
MATTPLWVPLAVAGLAVAGTLAGVIFTQAWNNRLDERRWTREGDRLREAQAREDADRTYEHRRGAYVDFLQELERLQRIVWAFDPEGRPLDDDDVDEVFKGLSERLVAVRVFGTYEADLLARDCLNKLQVSALHPEDAARSEDAVRAGAEYLLQIRKDLGVPRWIRRASDVPD